MKIRYHLILSLSLLLATAISCKKSSSSSSSPTPTGTDGSSSLTASAACLALALGDSLPALNPQTDLVMSSVSMEAFARGPYQEAKLIAVLDPSSRFPDAYYFHSCLMSDPTNCVDTLSSTPIEYTPLLPAGQLNITAQACVFAQRASQQTAPITLATYNNVPIYCGNTVSNVAVQSANTGLDQLAADIKQQYLIGQDIFNNGIYLYSLVGQSQQANMSIMANNNPVVLSQTDILTLGAASFADNLAIDLPTALQAVQQTNASSPNGTLGLDDSTGSSCVTPSSVASASTTPTDASSSVPNTSASSTVSGDTSSSNATGGSTTPPPPVQPPLATPGGNTASAVNTGSGTGTDTTVATGNSSELNAGIALMVVGGLATIGGGAYQYSNRTKGVVADKSGKVGDPGSAGGTKSLGALDPVALGTPTVPTKVTVTTTVKAQFAPTDMSTEAARVQFGVGSLDYTHALISGNFLGTNEKLKANTDILASVQALAKSGGKVEEINTKIDIAKRLYVLQDGDIAGFPPPYNVAKTLDGVALDKTAAATYLRQVYGPTFVKANGADILPKITPDILTPLAVAQKADRARVSTLIEGLYKAADGDKLDMTTNLDAVFTAYKTAQKFPIIAKLGDPVADFTINSTDDLKVLMQMRVTLYTAPDFTGDPFKDAAFKGLKTADGKEIFSAGGAVSAKDSLITLTGVVDPKAGTTRDDFRTGLVKLTPTAQPLTLAPGAVDPAKYNTEMQSLFVGGKKPTSGALDTIINDLSAKVGRTPDEDAKLQAAKDLRQAGYDDASTNVNVASLDAKTAKANIDAMYGGDDAVFNKIKIAAPDTAVDIKSFDAKVTVPPTLVATTPATVADPKVAATVADPKAVADTGFMKSFGGIIGMGAGLAMMVGGAVLTAVGSQNLAGDVNTTLNDQVGYTVTLIQNLIVARSNLDATIATDIANAGGTSN